MKKFEEPIHKRGFCLCGSRGVKKKFGGWVCAHCLSIEEERNGKEYKTSGKRFGKGAAKKAERRFAQVVEPYSFFQGQNKTQPHNGNY